MPAAGPKAFGRFWRRALFVLIGTVVLLGLLLLAAYVYLQARGVPEIVRVQIEERLRERGINVRFGELRPFGLRTLAANNVTLELDSSPNPTRVQFRRVQLTLDPAALFRFQFRPKTVAIFDGHAVHPLTGPDATVPELSFDQISGELKLPGSRSPVQLQLATRVRGIDLRLSGSLTNATAIRTWTLGRRGPSTTNWQARLDQVLNALGRVQVAGPASARINLQGDALVPASIQVDGSFQSAAAKYRDFAFESLQVSIGSRRLTHASAQSEVAVHLKAARAESRRGRLEDVQITGSISGTLTNLSLSKASAQAQSALAVIGSVTNQAVSLSAIVLPEATQPGRFQSDLLLDAELVQAPWGRSATNHVHLLLSHGRSRGEPWEIEYQTTTGPIASAWGGASQTEANGEVRPRPGGATQPAAEAELGPWAKLAPYLLSWDLKAREVHAPQLQLDALSAAGKWAAPVLTLRQVHAGLEGHNANGNAELNVSNRELVASAQLDLNAHRFAGLLKPSSQQWLHQFTWRVPPSISAQVRLVLPVWTNPVPHWREEVLPTVQLSGEFAGTDGGFRGVPVGYASSHFAFTNGTWTLPDLYLRRPDGEARLGYSADMQTHEFKFRVDARMDPRAARPLVDPVVQRVLDDFEFGVPPVVEGEVSGRWHDPSTVRFAGKVAATNFTFRGETCDRLSGVLRFGESQLYCTDVFIERSGMQIRVPSGSYDPVERVIYVTNAISSMPPALVTKVIGPKVFTAMRPYRFPTPPTVRVNGRLPTLNVQDADVRFEVVGETFSYWKLNAKNVSGDVVWRGDSLLITNVQASLYDGDLKWAGDVDFSPPIGGNVRFQGDLKHADLRQVMADLGNTPRRVEGSLDLQLTITDANSDDWRSWDGSGKVRLRDGFLWDIPIFGFFSPVLNTIVPGLGKSRVSSGAASFKIDESVIQTDNLELRSPALRLLYTGQVDLHGDVNARMQAEILRDAWGIGKVVSVALWPIAKAFEYRITGSIQKPKSEPVYIPKAFLWALHPLRTVKKMFEKPAPESESFDSAPSSEPVPAPDSESPP